MEQIEQNIHEIEQIAREVIPKCFEVRAVDLVAGDVAYGPRSAFTILVRIARRSANPEPADWGYALGQRIRERWGPDDFQLAIREESHRECFNE